MNKVKKILLVFFGLIGILFIWFWIEKNEYFNTNYRDLSSEQMKIFSWEKAEEQNVELKKIYSKYFNDTIYKFPRQKVFKIKLFSNIPLLGIFTGNTLKNEKKIELINLFNDENNFTWGETTWDISESEYYFNFYDEKEKVVGKIYVCMDDCFMTTSRPFCPVMKFGGLSKNAQWKINELIIDKNNWE